ncbi:MAG: hypothetical protein R8M45_11780 [Ghiorsea sp.]
MMIVIRSALFYVSFVVMTLIVVTLVTSSRIFGANAALQTAKLWGVCSNFLLRFLCNVHVKVEGLEHVPTEPCVVVAKHQSTWETTTLSQ